MNDLIEFLLEIVLDGSIELSSNKKVPNWIRYPLTIIISLFFLAVLFLIFYCGIIVLEESVLFGILLFLLGVFLLIGGIKKIHEYSLKNDKSREEKEKNSDTPIKF